MSLLERFALGLKRAFQTPLQQQAEKEAEERKKYPELYNHYDTDEHGYSGAWTPREAPGRGGAGK